jgi:hypothetical protein
VTGQSKVPHDYSAREPRNFCSPITSHRIEGSTARACGYGSQLRTYVVGGLYVTAQSESTTSTIPVHSGIPAPSGVVVVAGASEAHSGVSYEPLGRNRNSDPVTQHRIIEKVPASREGIDSHWLTPDAAWLRPVRSVLIGAFFRPHYFSQLLPIDGATLAQ